MLSLALFPLIVGIEKAHAAEGLTAQVYNVLGQNGSPYIPQGASPVLTANVPNIDLQWGSGSVLGGPSEDVIVRFTGSIRSDSTQNISFMATGDDGTRLYIDGALITDDWVDKGGGGSTSAPVSFTAGVPKTIELMYYENGGGANVFLYWDQSGSMDIIPASAFTSQAAPVVKTIGAPRNLTVTDGANSTVLTWEAPNTGNTQPERYAIGLNTEGQNGWGIATGNVGGPNSLNTTITIDHSLLESLMPSGTVWSFHIRSDNDTLGVYSENSNVVTLKIGKTQAEKDAETAAALEVQQELDRQASANTAVTNYENQPITTSAEVAIAESLKIIADSATAVVQNLNIKAALQSRIDAKTSAVTAAKIAIENARLQAEAAALLAAQQEAARIAAEQEAARQAAIIAEQNRLAEVARVEAERLAALAEAARIESERLAAIAAENARLAEIARLEAIAAENARLAEIARQAAINAENERLAEIARLAAIKAEADRLAALEAARVQAEKDRIAAEAAAKAEADRLAAEAAAKKAEEERIAAELAKAKAEEEARIAEEKRKKAEEDARIAEEARLKAEAESKAAEEARIAAEKAAKEAEEARLKAEEEAKIQAEKDRLAAEAAAKAESDRLKAEAEAKARAEEDARLEAIKKAQEEAKAKAEADRLAQIAKDKAAEEAKILAEQKAKEAEAARIKAEEDRKAAEQKALNDGKITAEDTKKVLDNINSDGKVTQAEVASIVEAIKQSDAPLTVEQKDLIATVVIAAAVSSGENVTAEQIQDAGIEYKDLPAETPVEVRTSESGETLVITAEVAANVELVTDAGALLEAAFTDPGAALAAIGSIGADMTEGEREEATEMVVATVVAAGAAMNAAAAAVGSTGGSSSGSSSGGGSGGGGASGNSKGVRRRP